MATTPKQAVTLTVNGEDHEVLIEARRTLADVLREDVGLTGTKLGCEHGVCGACTVLMDGSAVRSCLIFAVQAQDAEIATVESLDDDGKLDHVQQAFTDNHGLQCGFCTAGMLMSTHALLADNPDPTDDEIRVGLNGNLCRCTGYANIVKSVAAAAAAGKAATSSAQAS
ncbi:(2Fe-2S)-binding protein [Pseudonocardia sp.]|jgi:carbon-monoxide dehydrogenase small subunit|uniref:(2Fe-2S)-binding protein n=1 Tax=Pseudonocardia sp. TaxID=60912 RepID=UPI00262231C5|nr:(2Fe-2S)-binding protein [Pseudonocardia sp.]MCW2716781.1 (2Fe-2S)-binding domain protein [Pseudonocardia sp.]MDT7613994.1 aerobic carbon-monoxide dehydrogenase small subunit [Pseudonocardiales bacterium]